MARSSFPTQPLFHDLSHQFCWCGFSGPSLKLPSGLTDKHLHTRDGLCALGARVAEELGLDGVVDAVEDEVVGGELRGGVAEGGFIDNGVHADTGGIEVDVAAGVAEFIERGGDDFADFAVEFSRQRIRLVAGAIVYDNGGTIVGQGGDGGPASAACAEDGDSVVLQIFARDVEGCSDAIEDGGVVCGKASEGRCRKSC